MTAEPVIKADVTATEEYEKEAEVVESSTAWVELDADLVKF